MAEFVVTDVGLKAYRAGYYKRWKDMAKGNIVWFPIRTRIAKRWIARGLRFKDGVAPKPYQRRLVIRRWIK